MKICGKRSCVTVLVFAALLAATAGSASISDDASVIGVSPIPGTNLLNIGLAIPKGIANAGYKGHADWGVDVTVTYMSVNNKITTVDSGPISISSDTQLIGPIDNNTTAIQFNLSLGTADPPGNQPSYQTSATLIKP